MLGGEVVPISEFESQGPTSAYEDRVRVSRLVYSQETFDSVESATGGRPRDSRTCTQHLRDQLKKRCACSREKAKNAVLDQIPVLRWLPKYKIGENLIGDIMSGFTISVLHLPQGMAYGMLAELPAINGLYTSFFPPLVYFLFGTSRHISLGTMAVVALMTGASTEALALKKMPYSCPLLAEALTNSTSNSTTSFDAVDSEECFENLKKEIAFSLALLIGLLQILLGIFKFGFVATYMSEPLTKGFTTGAACHVFTAQVKYITSIYPPKKSGLFNLIYTYIGIFSHINQINWASVVTGFIMIVFIFFVKKWLSPFVKRKLWKSMPMPIPVDLLAVIIGTGISYGIDLEHRFDVPIVGDIPAGMPVPALPTVSHWPHVITDAFVIALVAFSIAISVAKILAKKNSYDVDANQELKALGLATAVSSAFACHVGSSSLSRSLLQEVSGKTQLAAVFSSIVILVVLLAIGPLFRCLPRCVLAAIIMVALRTMFLQTLDLPRLWRVSRWDFATWVLTFLSTVILDVPYGLLVGIIFSILQIMYRVQTPYACSLGRVGHTEIYKDQRVYREAEEIPGLKLIRFESFLFFGNLEFFKRSLVKLGGFDPIVHKMKVAKAKSKRDKLAKLAASSDASHPSPPALPALPFEYLVLDCSAINFLDYVGVTGLGALIDDYAAVGVVVVLTNVKAALREMILASGVSASIPDSAIFLSNHDAVLRYLGVAERRPLVAETMSGEADESEGGPMVAMEEDAPATLIVDEAEVFVLSQRVSNGEVGEFSRL